MRRFKILLFVLLAFIIVYFIFLTMNECVAQLIFFWGLSVIGSYIYKLCHLIFDKLNSIMNKKELK